MPRNEKTKKDKKHTHFFLSKRYDILCTSKSNKIKSTNSQCVADWWFVFRLLQMGD